MAGYNQREFVQALIKSPEERTPQDLKLIYSYMHVLEAVSSLKEANIRALCKTVRYERHDANDILYWGAATTLRLPEASEQAGAPMVATAAT